MCIAYTWQTCLAVNYLYLCDLIGRVDETDSIFITLRDVPKTTKDLTYVPLFVTPVVDQRTQDIITETCGDNSECAYDIAVTGNVDVGRETLDDIEEHMMIVNLSLPSTYVWFFVFAYILNLYHEEQTYS